MNNKIFKIICMLFLGLTVLPVMANDEFTEENLQSSIAQIKQNINGEELKQIILSDNFDLYSTKKSYQATDLLYIKQLGGGDETWISYKNTYIRFVKGENGAKSYWFYVYEKEEYNEESEFLQKIYENLPEKIIVQVYEGNLEEVLASKYDLKISDTTVINQGGVFSPMYFEADGIDLTVFTYWKPNHTVILSGFSQSGDLLSNLIMRDYDNSFPENKYGDNEKYDRWVKLYRLPISPIL